MIAQLGMYDPPPLHAANNRFWQEIRTRLGYGPKPLTRDGDVWQVWQSPSLLLSQTCGYPYRARLHGKVTLLGTPDYGLPDCPPGYYYSVFVVAADNRVTSPNELLSGCFAFNDALSQSGWAAPRTYFGVTPARLLETGSHAASAQAVAENHAQMAALDAVTWEILKAHDPVARDLRVIARTQPTPALPYISALGRDPTPIAAAIKGAIRDLSSDVRDLLMLKDLVPIPASAYLAVPTPPPPEQR
ncbi:phosphate/phosphite/phosphonate ABC transporter substrate-binding protein [Primorskyibacter sp. S87]|uniref:phosphate/phosphite/phosphonate ABC transporter substrate-binding protein n=1 Tax=Primorskyibacter sp. S87 TaxID=3415126 RepID=UPI003C7AEF78